MTSTEWLKQFALNTLYVSDPNINIEQYAKVLETLKGEKDPVVHVSKILAVFAKELLGDNCQKESFMNDAIDFIEKVG